jgi:hypothetical protein
MRMDQSTGQKRNPPLSTAGSLGSKRSDSGGFFSLMNEDRL